MSAPKGVAVPGRSIFSVPIALSLAFTVAASVFFLVLPEADLATTRLFYDGAGHFPLAQDPALNALRTISETLAWSIVALCLVSLAVRAAGLRRPRLLPVRGAVFLLSGYALGVGLLVNVILKNHWGRPRPIQVDQFGGDSPYITVWQISSYCETNCSFVSGEGSTAFWFVSLALFVPEKWRAGAFVLLLAFATVLSVNRIAFGAHFLSDVVIAWGLMAFILASLHRLLMKPGT
jgi:lipid A 4'-phosphatase